MTGFQTHLYLLEPVQHVLNVQSLMDEVIHCILARSRMHDRTKFYEPEVSGYPQMVRELKEAGFGTTATQS